MSSLRCVVRLEEGIEDLGARRRSFDFLRHATPVLSSASTWMRGHEESKDLQVIAVGKTGYGKSTTLNTLIRENVFETDDNVGCTRTLQSVEFKFNTADSLSYFSLADLPGLGESPIRDDEYFSLYRQVLQKAHVVLYFIRADQRDYRIDEKAFADLFCGDEVRRKIIIVINAIDKIEPLNREIPFKVTEGQLLNLEKKVQEVAKVFAVSKSDIVPIAGLEDFNTDLLVNKIQEKLMPYVANWVNFAELVKQHLSIRGSA